MGQWAAISGGVNSTVSGGADDLESKLDRVIEFTTEIVPRILSNLNAKKVPEYKVAASRLAAILIRSHLKPANLEQCTNESLEIILEEIRIKYLNSIIDYGTSIGIIAAQCISEPLTQYVLHSIHHAATGGTKKGGVARLKEVISPKEANMEESTMTIFLKDKEYSTAIKVANNIQCLKFSELLLYAQLIEEKKYGSAIADDIPMFEEFTKYNPLSRPPSNLTKWVFRFELSREKMIIKAISLNDIVIVLRNTFSTYIVHSNENSKNIIIRLYWPPVSKNKEYPSKDDMEKLLNEVIETKIRGINMISGAIVRKDISYYYVDDKNAIVKNKKESFIVTSGSNLYEILTNEMREYIDETLIRSDSILETYEMFGIEAARLLIIEELHKIVPEINPRHMMIYADEICSTGVPTSIERAGLKMRHRNNILLRIAHQAPIESLQYAAFHSVSAPVDGLSASLIMGRIPNIGTHYNQIGINEEFVNQYAISAEQQLAQMETL